ncbi:ATP-dependent DNA helicase PIF1-like protein [Tanacetum coccineum]
MEVLDIYLLTFERATSKKVTYGGINGTYYTATAIGKTTGDEVMLEDSKQADDAKAYRITPSDKRLPIKIVRKQYPLSISFAMTIDKSQGQSLSKVGLYLPCPVFTHGQLYVALSRVKSKRGLKVVVCDEEGNVSKTTTNVVYKEVLHGL